jgi:hypothetical protein
MEMNENTPKLCADLVLVRVTTAYAKEKSLTNTEALEHIMRTKTYALLENPVSKLCYETAESVSALLKAEERGDWEEWLKV